MTTPELSSSDLVMGEKPSFEALRWRYECDLHQQHVDARMLPSIEDPHALLAYEQWNSYVEARIEHNDSPLGTLAEWARQTIRRSPAGIDVARDVDGGGYTSERIESTMFTRWVPAFEDGTHMRLSESRTAYHNPMMQRGGALRSPVMGGLVVEATSDPESLDPRDAVSLIVMSFSREEDPGRSWLKAKEGKLFNFTPFREVPYTVGPLYNGHPNEIHDPAIQQNVTNIVRNLIEATVSKP